VTALAVTVDVDGEAGLPDGGRGWEQRLTSRSERSYGLLRGLPRILAVLDEFAVTATFYVPGVTAQRHPDEVRAIAAAGHELGHHGHTHRRPDTLDAAAQRAEIADGIAALAALTGSPGAALETTPRGYRAPGWELTPVTLDALLEHGLAYDSSLMGDDRPHVLKTARGPLVELPVHWSLDDAPHFAHTTDVAGLLTVWVAELCAARREDRHTTVTCHPEILGRAHRIDVLRRLLDAATGQAVECVTHGAVADVYAGVA
jgi:peptidoglycan/xylan/chitin deacetylase (PgdA/CDA1 family)